MNCPVCQLTLPESIPPFCTQCAWDLKNDLTLNTFISDIPKAEIDIYNARLGLACQNWEHIQQMKKEQAELQPSSTSTGGLWKESTTMNQDTGEPFELRNGDTNPRVNMNKLVNDYKLFIDTGSLLEPSANKVFIEVLLPLLQQHDAKVLVSGRTIDNLEYQRTSQNTSAQSKASDALKILRKLQDANRLLDAKDPHTIAGDSYDTVNLFKDIFIGYQMKFQLCLITQNETLAIQILKNSRSEAFNSVKDIKAVYVENGELNNWIPRILGKSKHQDNEVSISYVAAGFKIIADTSSILLSNVKDGTQIGLPFFRDILLPEIARHDNKLIVPNRVIRELQKHSRSTEQALVTSASEALSVLMMYDTKKRLVIGEDPHEVEGAGSTFADPVFLRLGIRFQSSRDICFITQDANLAKALLDNRNPSPSTGHQFLVTFIPQRSQQLVRWESKIANYKAGSEIKGTPKKQKAACPKNSPQAKPRNAQQPSTPDSKTDSDVKNETQSDDDTSEPFQKKHRIEPFALVKQVYALNNNPISVKQLPGVGGMVLDSGKKPVLLIEELAEGGEGKIFRTDRDILVCKVYHEDRITENRRKKLELMVSRDLRIREVCWPTDVVTNVDGQFVGYLMPKVDGKIMKTSVFAKPLLKKTFPHWTRVQLTQLAVTVLKAIERLHRLNIFIGDINPQNILVKDEHTIAIVDTDSFQVEGFPCPVGTETFTPPERQGMNYADFLRSEQDELFAVTTMLFMIMFVGKAPYSSQGGGEAAENIRNRTFAYDRDTEERPPIGAWQFIWSHLHPALKYDFIAVFSKGERIPIKDIIKHLNLSLAAMRKGERNNDLFPDKPWQRDGETVVVKCNSCPPDRADHEISIKHAEQLRVEGRSFRCSTCGALKKMGRLESSREVECSSHISPNCAGRVAVSIEHLNNLESQNQPFVCRICNEEKNFRMVQCGSRMSPNCVGRERVSITHLNNLATQNRVFWCSACNDAEKARRSSERKQRQSSSNRSTGRTTSYNKSSKKSDCFVATATYKSETAPQVLILRAYRDNIMMNTWMGIKVVNVYYHVGPRLAAVVNSIPVLRPCCLKILDRISTQIQKRMLKYPNNRKGGQYG